jgi:Putative zinc-finger
MRCTEAKPLFSSYIDGAVSGVEMHEVSNHLSECAVCESEYVMLEKSRALVSSLGRRPAPPELAMKLRIALASERSKSWRSVLRGYGVRLENVMNAFMFPATAGVVSAVIFFVALIGCFVVPIPVDASDDVPTMLYTPPRLEMSDSDIQIALESPVVIETYVGVTGRVEAYRIISGQDDEQIRQQLNRALLFTIFAPAQSFGRPVPGKAVMSFSHINVKG